MKECNIIICVGAGGVGKTTVASVIGLHHALKGEKTLVITVDPARRLLDALGVAEKGHSPKRVDISQFTKQKTAGELYAFMPDLKMEWMDFLKASIKRADIRHDIASNHFYQYMADGLPGAFEIICSHILFRLLKIGHYDCIVLDTPPSSHALNFFDVPNKIASVLDHSLFQSVIRKRNTFTLKLTKKLAFFSGNLLERTLERLIGSHFLSELIDFALTIDGLYEPLLERTRAMDRMLKDEHTRYVLVVRPELARVTDSIALQEALSKRQIAIDEIVINYVMPQIDYQAVEQEITWLKSKGMLEPALTSVRRLQSAAVGKANLEAHLINKIRDRFHHKNVYTLHTNNTKNRWQLLRDLTLDYQRT